MTNPIKQLAGQTVVYGLSSIVARVLSYLLVPIYTRVFMPSEYGIVNEMYAYVSLLIVILTYGFETGFFRFSESEQNKEKVYSTSLISLIVTSSTFVLFAVLFAQPIADILRYPDNKEYVVWFALIIALDAVASIPFARLRAMNKARRFAMIKVISIACNILLNLFFLVLCPYLQSKGIFPDFVDFVYKGKIGVGYVFISNLVSSFITILLLMPEMVKIPYRFSTTLWKKMMRYCLPLLIVGLAGIVNETMDRIFLKYLLPANISLHEVGIYGACYKISIIMTLFIQAFRFAAEPFFFAQARNSNAREIYADVMKYFVIVCSFIFLAVMLYIDAIKYFVGEEYYISVTQLKGGSFLNSIFGSEINGLMIIPVLLMANMFLGIYYNLSIWYKLIDRTGFGAFISVAGALITIVLNIWWIPILGYLGSAWATLICYGSMMVISFIYGQKHFHVKYPVRRIIAYIMLALGFYLISMVMNLDAGLFKWFIHTIVLFVFMITVYLVEKKNIASWILIKRKQ